MITAILTADRGHTQGINDPERVASRYAQRVPSLNTPAAVQFPKWVKTVNAIGYAIAVGLVLTSAIAMIAFCCIWRPAILLARYLRP